MSSGGFKEGRTHPKQSIKKGDVEREQPVTVEECCMQYTCHHFKPSCSFI